MRRFLKETPPGIATVVSGRSHFFNSDRELRNALGNDRFICVTLQEFTEEQVAEYLRNRNWTEATPSWLPTRPLLLGYLAARGLLQEVCEVEIGSSPANGWHSLLDRISAREAEIEAGIDAATVRRILERLGTRARASADGLGPLSTELIRHAFTEVCGYAPDERGMVLLQRLPGLGRAGSEDDSRTFVDQDFGQVAQAGDVFRYIEDPFNEQELERVDPGTWQASLSSLGVEVLALRCHGAGFNEGKLATAALRASDTKHGDTLCADITLGMQELHFSGSSGICVGTFP